MIARRVVVTGRVQGVWFRETTRRLALRHAVTGSVRNDPDGSVEAVFEGGEEAVASLIAFCHRGPTEARVDGVEVHDHPVRGLTGFDVR